MFEKISYSILPILAMVAFVVMPSTASASEYGTCALGTPVAKPPCKAGEKFTAFPLGTPENVVSKSTGAFVLEDEAGFHGIECAGVSFKGVFENTKNGAGEVDGVSRGQLSFKGCVPLKYAGCTEINPETNHEIVGEVNGEIVEEGKGVKITLQSGFNQRCAFDNEEEENLGGMWGTIEGTVKSNTLIFKNAKGIKIFFDDPAHITGTYETETEAGKKPVFIK